MTSAQKIPPRRLRRNGRVDHRSGAPLPRLSREAEELIGIARLMSRVEPNRWSVTIG